MDKPLVPKIRSGPAKIDVAHGRRTYDRVFEEKFLVRGGLIPGTYVELRMCVRMLGSQSLKQTVIGLPFTCFRNVGLVTSKERSSTCTHAHNEHRIILAYLAITPLFEADAVVAPVALVFKVDPPSAVIVRCCSVAAGQQSCRLKNIEIVAAMIKTPPTVHHSQPGPSQAPPRSPPSTRGVGQVGRHHRRMLSTTTDRHAGSQRAKNAPVFERRHHRQHGS